MRFKVPNRQPESFKASSLYLAGQVKGLSPDRVEFVQGHNLYTTDPRAAAAVMDATAAQNHRCKTPAYHFIITFDPKDAEAGKVSKEVKRDLARKVIDDMGLSEHQALVYSHQDTDHPHLHFLVNRIHPSRHKAYNRHRDGTRLAGIVQERARELGLNVLRNREYVREKGLEADLGPEPSDAEFWKAKREDRAAQRPFDKEAIRGLRDHLKPDFHEAGSWEELTQRLNAKGITMERKGQGLVLTDGDRFAKLSDMGKGVRFHTLEDRFGEEYDAFLNLVVRPRKGKGYDIISGERRYRALRLLAERGDIPADHPVPVDIRKRLSTADTLRLTTIENIQREQLPPMDEAGAFASLLADGASLEDVAAKAGVSALTVKRRVALASLCDEVKALVREGEVSLSVAEALTLGTHDQQRAVIERLEQGWHYDADDIRHILTGEKPSVALAIFPLEKYEGSYTADLFADDASTFFDDMEQFYRLQSEAVAQLADTHRQTAAFVEVVHEAYVPWWQYREAEDGEPGGVVIQFAPSGRVQVREGLVKREVRASVSRTTFPLSVVTVFWLLPLRRLGGWFWPSGPSSARSPPRCSSISAVSARSASALVSSDRMPSLPNKSSGDRPSISWSNRSLSMLIRGSPFRAVTTPEHKIQDSPTRPRDPRDNRHARRYKIRSRINLTTKSYARVR